MNKHLFLHCSDLHLGCTPNHLELRYNDFFDSFKELIDNAIKNECKYILISGDLFHLKVVNSKTLLNVINLLEYAIKNNIKIITIEGNHDKAFYVDETSWLHFLHQKGYITLLTHKIIDGNLIIDENSIYEDDNIRIIGIGYLGSITSIYLNNINEKVNKSDKFTVLMLHAAVNRLCGEDMGDVNVKTLEQLAGIVDYIALGHIHTKYEYNNFIYNPGSIENIRIKDGKKSNQKGYYIVCYNQDTKEKDVIFCVSKQRKINNISIKLENNKTLEEIEYLLINNNYNIEKNSVLELTIYGNVSFNPYLINFDKIKEKLIEKYKLIYIDINNLINIVSSNNIVDSVIDIKEIEQKAIKNYISINFPTLSDVDDFINQMQDIKNAIIDKQDYTLIIENTIKKVNEGE